VPCESYIQAIHEHKYGIEQTEKIVCGIYCVTNFGVIWLKHSGQYENFNNMVNKPLFSEEQTKLHSCYSQQVLYCGNDKEVYSIKCQDFKGEKVVKDKVWQGADAVGLIEYKGGVRVVK
jgi:hypothetical protein